MIYKEIQHFKQLWIWLIFIISGFAVIGNFGFGFYQQIILGIKFGDNPLSDNGLIITFILVLLLHLLIFFMLGYSRLITTIDKNGIEYRFAPFHIKPRIIEWSAIESYQVISYNPIREYGGWGIRYGKKGMAYSIRGDKGLLLNLKNSKTLLIGTQQVQELNDFLVQLKHSPDK
jgi:hypothetical protein